MNFPNLTPEQEAKFKEYQKKWLKLVLSSDCDKEKAEEDVCKISYQVGFEKPVIIWGRSPQECIELVQVIYYDKVFSSLTKESILEEFQKRKSSNDKIKICEDVYNLEIFWAFDAYYYDFLINELKIQESNKLIHLVELAKNCFSAYQMKRFAVLCEKPVESHLDENDYLHNEDGPAIAFADGFCVHCIHGCYIKK